MASTAKQVPVGALGATPPPPATASYAPLAHDAVHALVLAELAAAGYAVATITPITCRAGGSRLTLVYDLAAEVMPGVHAALLVTNSTDGSVPLGGALACRVAATEYLLPLEQLVKAKHSKRGPSRFGAGLHAVVCGLEGRRLLWASALRGYQRYELRRVEADSILLGAWERGVLSTRMLRPAVKAWRTPHPPPFDLPTVWALWHALATPLQPVLHTAPTRFLAQGLALQALVAHSLGELHAAQ